MRHYVFTDTRDRLVRHYVFTDTRDRLYTWSVAVYPAIHYSLS